MIDTFATVSDLIGRYPVYTISQIASHGIANPQIADAVLSDYLQSGTLPGDASDATVRAVGDRVTSAINGANGIVLPYAMRARAVADSQFAEGFRDAALKIAIYNLSNRGKSPDSTDKVTLDYESAIEWLRMVAEAGLDAQSGAASDPGWRNVTIRRV